MVTTLDVSIITREHDSSTSYDGYKGDCRKDTDKTVVGSIMKG